jgi:hypothetical protein
MVDAQRAAGASLPDAAAHAEALLARNYLAEQAAILAYMDDFAFFGMISIGVAGLACLLLLPGKSPAPPKVSAHEH